jgi:flagellar assembly protein FliH
VIREYRLAAPDEQPQETAPRPAPEDDAATESGADVAAETLLSQAQCQVAEMIDAARAQIAQMHQRAYEEGRQAGRQAGHEEGLRQTQAAGRQQVTQLAQLVESLISERARLLASAEEEVVELALAIARKVIGDAAADDPGVILQMVAQAVEVLGRPASYEVHVNPEDAQRIEAHLSDSEGSREWTLVADERVAAGGCTVNHGVSLVDARPETQLALIEQAFASLQRS